MKNHQFREYVTSVAFKNECATYGVEATRFDAAELLALLDKGGK